MPEEITETTEKKIIDRSQAFAAIASGKNLAELRGINEATIDFIYAFSALNYKRGQYEAAARGFRFLCRHKHLDPDMWLALARASFQNKDYEQALEAYLMLALLRPSASLCLETARAFMTVKMLEQAKVFAAAAARVLLPEDRDELRGEISALEKELKGLKELEGPSA